MPPSSVAGSAEAGIISTPLALGTRRLVLAAVNDNPYVEQAELCRMFSRILVTLMWSLAGLF